jgi:dephospho-CoA kinase
MRQAGVEVAVYMAPLLIEAGVTDRVDEIWVVYVDLETQIDRLMERDSISRSVAEQKIASQMPMEEKKGFGKIVIDNRGDMTHLEQQVRDAWRETLEGDGP